MTKNPQNTKTASITNASSELQNSVDGTEASFVLSAQNARIERGTELPNSYELLRREGELHEGRTTVIDELRRNMTRLEDLHGQLHFLLKEVESILRK